MVKELLKYKNSRNEIVQELERKENEYNQEVKEIKCYYEKELNNLNEANIKQEVIFK